MKTFIACAFASSLAVSSMAAFAASGVALPASAASAAAAMVKVEDKEFKQDKPTVKARKKTANSPQQAGGRPAAQP